MSVSLKAVVEKIEGSVLTKNSKIEDVFIEGGYVSDLLSDVMGNAKEKQVWITIMRHLNTVAVASLSNISSIIFTNNVCPEDSVIDKASEENVCLISTKYPSFETAGIIYGLLNR